MKTIVVRGKTQLTDWLFLYNSVQQIIDEGLNIKLKIFYFTLEMSKEEKMLACFSNILYVKEGIRVNPTDLKSTRSSNVLDEDILNILKKYEPYFNKIEEIVEFVDDTRHPYGIYNLVKSYADNNGKTYYRDIEIGDEKIKTFDHYEPYDPEEYVMIIIDHVSLISGEKRNNVMLSLHESISVLSSEYLIKLRNRYNYIPVIIQQQALIGENLEHRKAGALKPSPANLADNKLTIRDVNVALSIFSPFRNEITEHYNYDITEFRDNIRFLEIMISRDGGAGTICPLYFDGAVNFFKEMPLPQDYENLQKVKDLLKTIRNTKK